MRIGKLTLKQWFGVFSEGKGCPKPMAVLFLIFVTPFYGILTFYLLWNWFLADVLHVEITYWRSAGILLSVWVAMRFLSEGLERDDCWMGTRVVLAACLPENKIAAVTGEILRIEDKNKLFGADFKRFVAYTCAILFGWLIHVFLA